MGSSQNGIRVYNARMDRVWKPCRAGRNQLVDRENETDLDELLAITDEALNATQVLKTDSAKLEKQRAGVV